MTNEHITQHDARDGYHLGCVCDYCLPTTEANYAKEVEKVLNKSRPCTNCGWANGEREGTPLCDHCGPKVTTDHPGWKPEGFMREQISVDDAHKLIGRIAAAIPGHFEAYGAGIFTHPHEIVGCMFGQQMKLSAAADESIYDGELQKFRTRCVKTLMAMFVGLASVDKLIELRKVSNEAD